MEVKVQPTKPLKLNKQKVQTRKFIIISLAPILLLFLLFFVIPIGWGLIMAFFNYNPLKAENPFVGLENFNSLINDGLFRKTVINTFEFAILAVLVNLFITLPIALGITKIRSQRFKELFRTVYFLPCIAPIAGSSVIWATMFEKDVGLLNIILEGIGLNSISWLNDPQLALYSIIIMTLWADIGFNIVLFIVGLESIPTTFYEAAKIDGANAWVRFKNITLPLLKRTTIFIIIMTCASYFQAFTQFQILTNGEPQNETRVLALSIYDYAFTYFDMGYASAMAFVLFLIILVITIIQLRVGRTDWEY